MHYARTLIAIMVVACSALPAQTATTFRASVVPFLAANCLGCHNATKNTGGLNLEAYTTPDLLLRDRAKWERVLHKIESGEMPPKGLPRPPEAQRKAVERWIQSEFDRADAAAPPNAGRVTARRLNRAEYNNTVRDLLCVAFRPADDFPQDDSGYGFDTIGDALSLSPVLMEKYFAAAEQVSQTAIFGSPELKPTVVRHQPPYREGTDGGDNSRFLAALPYTVTDYDVTGLTLPSALHTLHTFPAEGDYEFRVSPEGNRPRPSEPFQVAIWIDGKTVQTVRFEATANPTGMEGLDQTAMVHAPAGEHWVAVSALRLFDGLPARYGGLSPTPQPEPAVQSGSGGGRGNRPPRITDVSFRVNFIEISGPFQSNTKPSPESLARIFVCREHTPACERRIVTLLARRAYRRPASPGEVNRLLALASDQQKRGASWEESIGVAIQAMLVSPNFLFRIEKDPAPGPSGDTAHLITQFDLAARLSYFLWSSMPDDELLRCAERNTLRDPATLNAQVRRMLKDPRAKALVENFGGQWLQFRALDSVRPDPVRFMAFNDYLRLSMKRETELFFENLLSNDGSVVDFLNGRYSFLNEELAQYYGIRGVKGPEFRRVDLAGSARGGVLTHGSVLTASSYATRTSVVLRGKWVLDNLLNSPVPPPPPDVPVLDEAAVGTSMSLRQQMEKHRTNTICAACHARMDPLGFGLENFDAIGRWRTHDGAFPVDSSGILPDGRSFKGPEELRQILAANRDAFTEGLTEKMIIFALGRGLSPADKPAIRAIARQTAQNDYRITALVLGIAGSVPFQQRQGDRVSNDR
jgi:Protein of unknown function (DUF1592)/Protein of unknown function (DUF1588)/Protein of unknown function (DUF1587)/Protein of unknown function (DUF1585)/Protein of unknown function (DUF1595)/Planctomycete cytochrome C